MLKKGGFKKIISETQGKKQEEGLSRKKSKKKNPCWKGYEAIGMKKKVEKLYLIVFQRKRKNNVYTRKFSIF